MKKVIVVTRHPGALEWLSRHADAVASTAGVTREELEAALASPLASATPADVAGAVVVTVGDLPLYTAANAEYVAVVEFAGAAPSGEYTAEDMDAAGARLQLYHAVELKAGGSWEHRGGPQLLPMTTETDPVVLDWLRLHSAEIASLLSCDEVSARNILSNPVEDPDDIRHRAIVGRLSLSQAVVAKCVVAPNGPIPSQAATTADIDAAGVRLAAYCVTDIPVYTSPVDIDYDDRLGPRRHSRILLVGRGEKIYSFGEVGDHIPGVVAVLQRDYERNGIWSGSTWRLRLAPGAWYYISRQDWETGERFHEQRTILEVVQELRAAGCRASSEVILKRLEEIFPRTCERLRKREAALASLSEMPEE